MSETSLEATGKSIEDAIQKGLAQLGLSREAVDIEILRQGSRGLLGWGGEPVLVRLTPRKVAGPATLSGVESTQPHVGIEGAEAAKEILETLLRGMGISGRVEVLPDAEAQDDGSFALNILGNDLGVLIGRRGETLRDLEFLTRLLTAHRTNTSTRLIVDVEGYRTRRERVLRELAKRMGERVQTNRQPITLEAMPPNERRIVHLALRDHPAVTTHSIGEGDHRRVMILPK